MLPPFVPLHALAVVVGRCMWLRLEHPTQEAIRQSRSGQVATRQPIMCLRASDGQGLELGLVGSRLALYSWEAGDKRLVSAEGAVNARVYWEMAVISRSLPWPAVWSAHVHAWDVLLREGVGVGACTWRGA